MFLRTKNNDLEQDTESSASSGKQAGPDIDIRQSAATLASTADQLLEFRLFAIKHGHTYLGRIIEPVVKETLNLLHGLDQKYDKHGLTEKYHLQEVNNGPNFDLSEFELDCLKWCSLGKTDHEIAIELGVQESTIIRQMKLICKKLNTRTDAQSVARVIRLKLI